MYVNLHERYSPIQGVYMCLIASSPDHSHVFNAGDEAMCLMYTHTHIYTARTHTHTHTHTHTCTHTHTHTHTLLPRTLTPNRAGISRSGSWLGSLQVNDGIWYALHTHTQSMDELVRHSGLLWV